MPFKNYSDSFTSKIEELKRNKRLQQLHRRKIKKAQVDRELHIATISRKETSEVKKIQVDAERKKRIIRKKAKAFIERFSTAKCMLISQFEYLRRAACKELASERILWKQEEVKRLGKKLTYKKESKWQDFSREQQADVIKPFDCNLKEGEESDDESILEQTIYLKSGYHSLFMEWGMYDEVWKLIHEMDYPHSIFDSTDDENDTE